MTPRITLEQWQALVAVVDAGGYAQAAERLHKSQSSVTYLVQKLESLLDVKAFEIKGRKAALTPTGEMLYRRARTLLEEAVGLEKTAKSASAGWEAEIRIAAEIVFPAWLLLKCFDRLNAESPHTRIEYFESVIAGTNELLLAGRADLAITTQIPQGFTGALLMPLPLREGAERVGQLYLVYADRENAGPGTLRLAEIIREMVKSECAGARSGSGTELRDASRAGAGTTS